VRDSADSDDYGVTRRGRKRGKFGNETTFAKREWHLPRLAAEDASDATGGLPDALDTTGPQWGMTRCRCDSVMTSRSM
jgi:hypothetical protein